MRGHPRSQRVVPGEAGTYHCVARCVRRALPAFGVDARCAYGLWVSTFAPLWIVGVHDCACVYQNRAVSGLAAPTS